MPAGKIKINNNHENDRAIKQKKKMMGGERLQPTIAP